MKTAAWIMATAGIALAAFGFFFEGIRANTYTGLGICIILVAMMLQTESGKPAR